MNKTEFLQWATDKLPAKSRPVIAWRTLSKTASKGDDKHLCERLKHLIKTELVNGRKQPLMSKAQLLDELGDWFDCRPLFDSEIDDICSRDLERVLAAKAELLDCEYVEEFEIDYWVLGFDSMIDRLTEEIGNCRMRTEIWLRDDLHE